MTTPRFRRATVELAPGESLDAAAWLDAIVFVTAGELELECTRGGLRRFTAGAVLCAVPSLRLIRNCGAVSAQFVAVSRRTG